MPGDNVETLKKEGHAPLAVNQDDPELQEQVASFISDNTKPVEKAPDRSRGVIPPDTGILQTTPAEELMTEALVDTKDLAITDIEKDLFVKAILNDVPYQMPVALFAGKFTAELRSRSSYEQRRIFDFVQLDISEKIFEEGNFSMMITRTQQYAIAFAVCRLNGKVFSELKLEPGGDLKEEAAKVREFVKANLEGITNIKWTALLNAFRVYETKCAKLSTMAINEDFWLPRATV